MASPAGINPHIYTTPVTGAASVSEQDITIDPTLGNCWPGLYIITVAVPSGSSSPVPSFQILITTQASWWSWFGLNAASWVSVVSVIFAAMCCITVTFQCIRRY